MRADNVLRLSLPSRLTQSTIISAVAILCRPTMSILPFYWGVDAAASLTTERIQREETCKYFLALTVIQGSFDLVDSPGLLAGLHSGRLTQPDWALSVSHLKAFLFHNPGRQTMSHEFWFKPYQGSCDGFSTSRSSTHLQHWALDKSLWDRISESVHLGFCIL